MSLKKGYNYANINEFCEKYKCKLLSFEDEINNSESKEFKIQSRCGHETTISFNKLFKKRIGIFCNDCFKNHEIEGTTCLACNNKFTPTINRPIFCSIECSHSRIITEEHKQKTRTAICKKLNYYDNNGNLIDSKEELKTLRAKRHKQVRQQNGVDDILIDTMKTYKQPELKYHRITKQPATIKRHIWTHELVSAEYDKKGCILLTTKEEFDKLKAEQLLTYLRLKIKSSCGHITKDSLFYNFLTDGTGINCKICTLKIMTANAINNSKENGITKACLIENTGVNLIREICKDSFEIIKTRECCEADILIRPKGMAEDKWLKIQLKVSNYRRYAYNIRREYTNMLILLVHLDDKKFWLIESNETKQEKIMIGKEKSIYDTYETTNINSSFTYWYNRQIYNTTFEEGNMPQSICAQLEYKFVKHRKSKINFLNFIDSEIDGLVYDFKINDLKIQEKVCTDSDNKKIVSLYKSNGTINKKRQYQSYYEHDNDFYWFNDKNKKTFYVIPEKEFILRGYVSTEQTEGKKYFNIKSNDHWLFMYEFNYDTINEEPNKSKLLKLLKQ